MKKHIFITLLISIVTTGCAMQPPAQNAKEYRANILKGGNGTMHESYTVKQPYWKLVKTIKAKTKSCLKTEVKTTTCGGIYGQACNTKTYNYNPTFVVGKNKSVLRVQVEMSKTLYLAGDPPKGGQYIAVIDFIKVGKNKTKVKVYAPDRFFITVPKAVKHWAKRTSRGCPKFEPGYLKYAKDD